MDEWFDVQTIIKLATLFSYAILVGTLKLLGIRSLLKEQEQREEQQ